HYRAAGVANGMIRCASKPQPALRSSVGEELIHLGDRDGTPHPPLKLHQISTGGDTSTSIIMDLNATRIEHRQHSHRLPNGLTLFAPLFAPLFAAGLPAPAVVLAGERTVNRPGGRCHDLLQDAPRDQASVNSSSTWETVTARRTHRSSCTRSVQEVRRPRASSWSSIPRASSTANTPITSPTAIPTTLPASRPLP